DFELQAADAQQDGEGRWLLPLPLPPGDLRDSFADRDQRTLPLRLTQDVAVHFHVSVDPGDDRDFVELPAPVLETFGPLAYQLTFTRDGRALAIDRRMRLRPATLSVALYPDWLRVLA